MAFERAPLSSMTLGRGLEPHLRTAEARAEGVRVLQRARRAPLQARDEVLDKGDVEVPEDGHLCGKGWGEEGQGHEG